MFFRQEVAAIAGIIKEIGLRIRFWFSDGEKFKHNLGLLKQKYWFQEMLMNKATLEKVILENHEIKNYLTSSKNTRKLLHNSQERKKFKERLEEKHNIK
ncbi:hypothetical protein [Paenibacillus sp. Soil522]|uniref:hypothetical protein n=1 Tax=Paenibacillus sp. Soil522 TaxID=1736388 RepID=UPI0006F777DC|nr:hypothetical protein [Paenibacillus sp. Soil522]KRE40902.1 hypothetical protein ASG81_16810 [Paenibacillus sp. Soil522]